MVSDILLKGLNGSKKYTHRRSTYSHTGMKKSVRNRKTIDTFENYKSNDRVVAISMNGRLRHLVGKTVKMNVAM